MREKKGKWKRAEKYMYLSRGLKSEVTLITLYFVFLQVQYGIITCSSSKWYYDDNNDQTDWLFKMRVH